MSSSDGVLAGATVIVNGAGSGIGEATAEQFAAEGANLVLTGRRGHLLEAVAERARSAGVEVLVDALDVVDGPAADACVARAYEHFGRLDVLAHVAGINIPRHSLQEVPRRKVGEADPEDWRRVIDVNVNGVFNFVHSVIGPFRSSGGGSIVIMGSDAGLVSNGLAGGAYCASKFAVTGLVQSVNLEERSNGIRACAIQAGEVETPLIETRPIQPTVSKRLFMLRPADVARAIVFVASQPGWVNIEQLTIRPTLDQEYPTAPEILSGWKSRSAVA